MTDLVREGFAVHPAEGNRLKGVAGKRDVGVVELSPQGTALLVRMLLEDRVAEWRHERRAFAQAGESVLIEDVDSGAGVGDLERVVSLLTDRGEQGA